MNDNKKIIPSNSYITLTQRTQILPFVQEGISDLVYENRWDRYFIFDVIICDNDINISNNKFSIPALFQINSLIHGKTGILDVNCDGTTYNARIFNSHVECANGETTKDGEPLLFVRASAFTKHSIITKKICDGFYTGIDLGCVISKSHYVEESCLESDSKRLGKAVNNLQPTINVIDSISDVHVWSLIQNAKVLKCPLKKGNGKCNILNCYCFEVDDKDCDNLQAAYSIGRTGFSNNENQNNN